MVDDLCTGRKKVRVIFNVNFYTYTDYGRHDLLGQGFSFTLLSVVVYGASADFWLIVELSRSASKANEPSSSPGGLCPSDTGGFGHGAGQRRRRNINFRTSWGYRRTGWRDGPRPGTSNTTKSLGKGREAPQCLPTLVCLQT